MRLLARALSAEVLKLKRTIALWMVIVAPMVVVLLQFLMMSQRPKFYVGADGWRILHGGIYSLWAVGMLPLFVTLETALLAGIEHSQKSWKHLFALPVPRAIFYAAKVLVGAAIIAMSCVVLALGTVTAGLLLRGLMPKTTFGAVPWRELLTGAGAMFIASWLLVALHSWVALRWPSFALASGVGMAATVGTLVIASSQQWWKFYPWALPLHASMGTQAAELAMMLGAFGGLAAAVLGCWDMTRRDVL
jgi:lantibiotic transport system permease protein